VFAAEPPEASTPGGITPWRKLARSASMRVIAPLVRPCSSMKASSTDARTSTIAFPTPTTSME
jgi:hypothetical protein